MIYQTKYKDREAIAVETACLTLLILPQDGAKLVSLKRKADGKELLVTKTGETYNVLSYEGSYVESECSGFDDMFPTVDPETVEGIPYPDHGECCRLPYEATIAEDQLILKAESKLFSVTYEKRVYVAGDDTICLDYRIENHQNTPLPFLWAGHIMLAGEEGMRILTPFAEGTPTEMMFIDPNTARADGLPYDRLMKHEAGRGVAYKFYYLSPMPKGEFGVSYPNGQKLLFTVDPKKLPYLGLWLNNGTFQDGYSITPEPCTAPFDATGRGAERGYGAKIPANAAFSFDIKIQLTEE
ncbi:MAG: hypothetical protein IJN80_07560 [Clostridia bacterium]|nr:hypothetical protein [Clostridia bacterium]